MTDLALILLSEAVARVERKRLADVIKTELAKASVETSYGKGQIVALNRVLNQITEG